MEEAVANIMTISASKSLSPLNVRGAGFIAANIFYAINGLMIPGERLILLRAQPAHLPIHEGATHQVDEPSSSKASSEITILDSASLFKLIEVGVIGLTLKEKIRSTI
jgi:hypothetical protein